MNSIMRNSDGYKNCRHGFLYEMGGGFMGRNHEVITEQFLLDENGE